MKNTTFKILFADGVSDSATASILYPKIKKGYWGNMDGKEIKKLYFGETVYYFIETEDIPNDKEVTLKIFERDDIPYTDDQLNDDVYSIVIKDNKGRVSFKIKESWLGLEERNDEKILTQNYSQQKEEIKLFGELNYKTLTKEFRDTIIKLYFPLEDIKLEEGGGNAEHQRFTAAVKGTKADYEKFKDIFTGSPNKITNNLLATYVPFDRNNDGVFGEGDQIDINIKGPDNGSVRVAKVIINDNSFEVYFQTLAGHTDAGNIRFSGKFIKDYFNSADSFVEFEVYNITRLNVVLGTIGRIMGGGHISRVNQKRQWKNVLANFCNFMKKDTFLATTHIIAYKWNSSEQRLGKMISNDTTIVTNVVNQCRTKPFNFGITDEKIW